MGANEKAPGDNRAARRHAPQKAEELPGSLLIPILKLILIYYAGLAAGEDKKQKRLGAAREMKVM